MAALLMSGPTLSAQRTWIVDASNGTGYLDLTNGVRLLVGD